MVVARILNPEEEKLIKRPSSPSLTKHKTISILSSHNDIADVQQLPPYSPHIFRHYILTKIETISRPDTEKPVKNSLFKSSIQKPDYFLVIILKL